MINIIYDCLEFLVPLELMEYDFVKNAVLGILIIAPLFGIMGTMVVNNKMSFFSDALGHSALTGLAIGALIGISNYSIAMIIFAVIFAVGINYIKSKDTASTDAVISAFSSTSLAIGLIILSRLGGISKFSSILVGDILSINFSEICVLVLVLLIVLIFWAVFFNRILAINVNPSLAKTKKMRVKFIQNVFCIMIAVVVTVTIRWVGLLIINAMLILPAAAAKNISTNMRQYTGYSIIISLVSGILGLFISYFYDFSTGPLIVVLSALFYFTTFIFRRKTT